MGKLWNNQEWNEKCKPAWRYVQIQGEMFVPYQDFPKKLFEESESQKHSYKKENTGCRFKNRKLIKLLCFFLLYFSDVN